MRRNAAQAHSFRKISRERAMGENICDLSSRRCKPCEGGTPPLGKEEIERLLGPLDGWEFQDGAIARRFEFKNFYQTMAFVNAVAWIAHNEDHHPDLDVSYRHCRVRYITHAVGGLSENDFICAARVNALMA
jgi:4a-hydroxytetrahydrobiopterin dehydratase